MPELLAAFVLPNDPAVDRVNKGAAEALRRAGKPSGLDGYTSGSRQRVWELASAIWASVASLKLDYSLPPASFETEGQKIRLPSQIADSRLATCLDTTLLFAACLEGAGLNPVCVMQKGHAFVGVWLVPEEFSSVTLDDVVAVRKRLDLNELIVFETTLVAQHPVAPFSAALREGKDKLREELEGEFALVVDIRRARMQRIKPLPAAGEPLAAGESEGTEAQVLAVEQPPPLPDFELAAAEQEERPDTRLDRWQRHLLDLSLRNKLLNYKPTKKTIPFVCPDPAALEDRLADGKKLKIVSLPRLSDEQQGRDAELFRQRTGERLDQEYAQEALSRNEAVVALAANELDARLTGLYRQAKSDLAEGGSNTLFLAIGFLAWNKSPKDERRYRAPLILVPVSLERRSVRAGIRMVHHDDEARFNSTLLEMLKQDFDLKLPGFDDALPEDASGIDVESVWNQVAHHVKDVPGFEVVKEVALSTFSFSKYLMWKDLVDRTDALRESPVVKHLIDTPREAFSSGGEFPVPKRLDDEYSPKDLYCPLPADSSQLAAVAAAVRGKDFVLIGPPGTGKSQTIANTIAQCIAEGRTVLFVAEKAAALDVVYRRLKEQGFGEFCLELHSNKARKLDVLAQLRAAWESEEAAIADQWSREADKLGALRLTLNHFVARLHHTYPNGWTPFQAMGRVVEGRTRFAPKLEWPSADTHYRDQYERLVECAKRISVAVEAAGGLEDNPLDAVTATDWSPELQENVSVAARDVASRAREAQTAIDTLRKQLGLESTPRAKSAVLDGLQRLAANLPAMYGIDCRFVFAPNLTRLAADVSAAGESYAGFTAAQESLSVPFAEDAWSALPLDELHQRWQDAEATWWPKSWFARRAVRKVLAASATGKPDSAKDIPALIAIRAAARKIEAFTELPTGLGGLWQGLETDFARVQPLLTAATEIRAAVGSLSSDAEGLSAVRASVEQAIVHANELLAPEASVGRACHDASATLAKLDEALDRLESIAGRGLRDHVEDSEEWLATLIEAADDLHERRARLRDWCNWQSVRQGAVQLGLATLVEATEEGKVKPADVPAAFELAYARWWINTVMGQDDVLRRFVTAEHERQIQEFQECDERFRKLSRSYIRAKLCGQLPEADEGTRKSELGILRRELEKKRRHKPLRTLIEEMPTALTRLTPCLLMSPLSIAQYLSADQSLFDVVIFDEASQIPVWDAVGAVARAKQAIIVGDPKQLPPTSFFGRSDDEEDDSVDVEGDLESILDEALGANIPARRLAWHYRSRHESLIAFSNHRYYGGNLVTFPSPVTEDRGVHYRHVSAGVYEKGGARVNKAEAQAVADEIVARLRSSLDLPPDDRPTIGVVTFNSEQQRLIEDLLDVARRDDPELEWFFSEDRLEPVMVKNLESVQGDERDIMFFSITYGPDAAGRVSMNFGPMNKEGGERRLNVAITRARQELLVFATLQPDQIDLSRTQAAGVRDLKHFLEFAERGPRALAEAVSGSVGDYESPFESAVAEALQSRGWQVHPQIGVSSFRIDLGVVHPDAPGRYLAGVECDGATYHRAATARDRDKIRESVLRSLGWEILRVWSTDWWTDTKTALERLDEGLKELLTRDRDRAAETGGDTPDAAQVSAPGVEDKAETEVDSGSAAAAEPVADDSDRPESPLPPASPAPEPAATSHPDTQRRVADQPTDEARPPATYRVSDPRTAVDSVDPDAFYERSYKSTLERMIDHVIDAEGPVHRDVIARRIGRAHGFQRAGSRIRKRVNDALRGREKTHEDVGDFLWPNGTIVDVMPFRAPATEEDRRPPDETPMAELIGLAQSVLDGLYDGDPAVEMARAMGLARLRAVTRPRLEAAITLARRHTRE